MRKWLFFFAFVLPTLGWADPLLDRRLDSTALASLTTALGIPAEEEIVPATQKRWLREPGKERWEQAELDTEQRSFVLQWAREQGLFDEWKPSQNLYDKALVLGCTSGRMAMRLNHLKKLWNEGVRFSEVVWLTGERPLDQAVDNLYGRCQTEAEAAQIVWEEADLPEEMRALPVVYVEVPMEGTRRPNTGDTLIAWVKTAPEACTALFISDQPFCGYQFAVVNSFLPRTIHFDVAGPGVAPDIHPAAAAITLDTIARWLYQQSR